MTWSSKPQTLKKPPPTLKKLPNLQAFQAVEFEEELGSKAPPPDHQDEIILFAFLSGARAQSITSIDPQPLR
jgi:hypothetical protein